MNIAPLPKSLPTAIPLSNGAIGNEPHHVGVSADKKWLAGGGLLSILRVQNQNFFWDITNPRAPKFVKANTLPVTASIADGVVALDDTFYVSSWQSSSVYRGRLGGEFEVAIADQTSPGDLALDTKRGRLLVPHFEEDTLEAFDLR